MPQHTPDHAEHDHEQDNGGDDATVLPFRRTRSSTQDTWRVERIDTEPMTTQQYDLAVATLATLIAEWSANQENPKGGNEKAA
ncbi:hypothetical protein EV191_12150 [Tamaricihabitans halophyticus]|uniref:Uncharacterized protein n=2 Tax=Pseudonocardiaceae TaxID=2070 RepID=A0A4R2Q4U6_9PSEU|nr:MULTISPECIES: hypothetical protein [Pseudonocardiaceae]TCP43650.1 hypothetical protein EV191_12150 [Tamaricihabitans halophyticus]TKG59615.1 hypothetical protein FCN18_36640 [Prauserella endophytica]